MIYILGKNRTFWDFEYLDLDEIIVATSTKFENILKCADEKIPIHSLFRYEILCLDEGLTVFNKIELHDNAYDLFIEKHVNKEFINNEYQNEYLYVCNILNIWCDNIKYKKRKIQEEEERKKQERKEYEERLLYEKLKAKYGD